MPDSVGLCVARDKVPGQRAMAYLFVGDKEVRTASWIQGPSRRWRWSSLYRFTSRILSLVQADDPH